MELQTADRFNAEHVLDWLEMRFGHAQTTEQVLEAACRRIIHLEMVVDDMMEALNHD